MIVSGVGGGVVIEREGGSLAPAGRGGKRSGEKFIKRDIYTDVKLKIAEITYKASC